MRSTDVGIPQNTMVLGKHSGKHALRERLESLGYTISDSQLEEIFVRFKALADKKKSITNSDLEALALNRRRNDVGGWQLRSHVVNVGDGLPNTSCIKLERDDEVKEEVAIGSGPLDASFKAINRITDMDVNLESFSLNAVTDGEDAIGEAVVKISHDGEIYTGTGISTDIIESSIRAYINGATTARSTPAPASPPISSNLPSAPISMASIKPPRLRGRRRLTHHEHDNDTKDPGSPRRAAGGPGRPADPGQAGHRPVQRYHLSRGHQ